MQAGSSFAPLLQIQTHEGTIVCLCASSIAFVAAAVALPGPAHADCQSNGLFKQFAKPMQVAVFSVEALLRSVAALIQHLNDATLSVKQ